jgi:septum formation protein
MGESKPMRLILASASLGRRVLLERTGIAFEVMPADIPEPESGFSDPRTMVQTVAWLKAAAVAPRVAEGLVLAADTIGWINGHPVLKAADEDDARRILRELAGSVHELWTGVVLWHRPEDLQIAWQERSLVSFAGMTGERLEEYLATRSWRGHSGAYAIKEEGDPFVSVVDGSLTNVIGLPLESLGRVLGWMGGRSPARQN